MTDSTPNPEFEALLDYVKRSRSFDFTGYKRSSLMRRVNKQMQAVDIEGYSNYLDYLEVHPDEFSHLFNTLLINVTSFFRDRPAWEHLGTEIVPQILNRKNSSEPIRIWSAGCASGEEAYTAAILMAETLGMEQCQRRVKIYATDMDEDALTQACHTTYSTHQVGGGRAITCRVTCTPLIGPHNEIQGGTMLMEEHEENTPSD